MKRKSSHHFLTHDKVKLCVHGEPVWRENGKRALGLREKGIAEYIRTTASKRDGLTLFLHNYSSEDPSQLRSEIAALMQTAQSFNRRSSIIEGHSKSCGLMIGLGPFKWGFPVILYSPVLGARLVGRSSKMVLTAHIRRLKMRNGTPL